MTELCGGIGYCLGLRPDSIAAAAVIALEGAKRCSGTCGDGLDQRISGPTKAYQPSRIGRTGTSAVTMGIRFTDPAGAANWRASYNAFVSRHHGYAQANRRLLWMRRRDIEGGKQRSRTVPYIAWGPSFGHARQHGLLAVECLYLRLLIDT